MIQSILDALLPNWQSKIIAFSTDGKNTMTGRHSGIVTQIDKEADFDLMRIGVPLIRLTSSSRRLLIQCMRGYFTRLSTISVFIYVSSQIFNWKWEVGAQKTQTNWLTLSAFYPGCSNIAAVSWFGLLRRILPVPQTMDGG